MALDRLKKIILLFGLFILLAGTSFGEGFRKNPHLTIESLEPVEINGIKQWILIRGTNASNPVLLYLHGGPGHSAIPFAHVATEKLVDKMTVVYWDQRGAGLSYDERIPVKTMNINQFIDDTKKVTDYLKDKFHQDKIYLLGHSWGSSLGTMVVSKFPGDYYAYIGVGQVISRKRMTEERMKWLEKTVAVQGTPDEQKALGGMTNTSAQLKLIQKYGGSVHRPGTRAGWIMRNSPYYPEMYTNALYDKGNAFAQPLYGSILQMDLLKQVKELRVPVYFFCGRYDYVTPTQPVIEYYKALKAPSKAVIWFEESAHRMDIEEPEKFQNSIMKIAETHTLK
jgi:pimeloyl-ACP methyl ester carboxylesterase